MQRARTHRSRAGLRAASSRVSRYQPHSRCVHARRHGRLTLFARGARGPKSKLASLLMPFRPLLMSWSGRGDAAQLSGAEPDGEALALPPRQVLSGFYLNELIINLTTRHDPQPQLFSDYDQALRRLATDAAPELALRVFEKRLLESHRLRPGVRRRRRRLLPVPADAGAVASARRRAGRVFRPLPAGAAAGNPGRRRDARRRAPRAAPGAGPLSGRPRASHAHRGAVDVAARKCMSSLSDHRARHQHRPRRHRAPGAPRAVPGSGACRTAGRAGRRRQHHAASARRPPAHPGSRRARACGRCCRRA